MRARCVRLRPRTAVARGEYGRLYGRVVTRAPLGPALDTARALVAERELTGAAVGALTDVVRRLPIESLAPVKRALKQFFSTQPWTEPDDAALADLIGAAGETESGPHRLELDNELALEWGWHDDRFVLRVSFTGTAPERDLAPRFTADVAPEVTPNPRTLRFTTPPLHRGPSRVYDSITDAADDPRVARIFSEFDSVTNVLIGPAFVAVSIVRPDQWEALLAPMLQTITEEFTGTEAEPDARPAPEPTAANPAPVNDPSRSPRQLEIAWAELGTLRAERPDDLDRIVAASHDADAAHRQVAAALFADAPAAVAADGWTRLFGDESRSVRRSVVDAVVDAEREEMRALLERALADPDAWIRWKALRGIAVLGAAPSRAAIEALIGDPDFRVRLEATQVLA